jgi:Peroxidase
MKLCPTILGLVALFLGLGEAQVTWPNAIDELEDVMFLNSGYRSRGFGAHVTPCSFSEFGAGRQTAAEWLRIGFHDMATTNVFFAPHGGIDGSIQFELNDGENIGLGFNTTLHTYSNFLNSRLPIADLIALGVYASVRTVRLIEFLNNTLSSYCETFSSSRAFPTYSKRAFLDHKDPLR